MAPLMHRVNQESSYSAAESVLLEGKATPFGMVEQPFRDHHIQAISRLHRLSPHRHLLPHVCVAGVELARCVFSSVHLLCRPHPTPRTARPIRIYGPGVLEPQAKAMTWWVG